MLSCEWTIFVNPPPKKNGKQIIKGKQILCKKTYCKKSLASLLEQPLFSEEKEEENKFGMIFFH